MVQILEQYLSAVVLFGMAALTVAAFIILNKLFAPKRRLVNQFEGINAFVAYECGEIPIGEAQSRFNFQYYVFALVFVVFDVVSSFLLAWALIIKNANDAVAVFVSAFVFLGVLFVGFVYWWKRNALRWM